MIRFFDIVFSGVALIALVPLLLPIIVALKISGEGEIFFLQERIGQNKKVFKLFKFATMIKDSPNIGTGTVTLKSDPRVLPFGRFLRKTKINELPQLLNVFLGNMSIIGPRPQTLRCFEAFSKNSQEIIVHVKPGLSGIGPIIFRGEEDILDEHLEALNFYDNVIGPYKGEVEAWYFDKQYLSIYFCLIFLTVWIICFPKSDLIWRVFKSLPTPPKDLRNALNFPY